METGEASVYSESSAKVAEVGRLVDSSQADDRRVIRLVRDRPILYARTNMPVASYYTNVKHLWKEVADEMGWTVADVRRKWSHIRNSYSRHLRNEMYGVRTGKGRMVSKWYLADELEFLRDHMATDTFPRSEVKRDIWRKIISRENRTPLWKPSNNSVVCSLHFKESDFYITDKGLRWLQRDAVPTIFVPNKPSDEEIALLAENQALLDMDVDDVDTISSDSEESQEPSPEDCQKMWVNIRNNYRKALKSRVKYSNGDPSKKRRPIKFENELNFLRKFIQDRPQKAGNRENHSEVEMQITPDIPSPPETPSCQESFSSSSYNRDQHPVEMFFQSLAATVKEFPPKLQAAVKCDVLRIVTDAEVKHADYLESSGASRKMRSSTPRRSDPPPAAREMKESRKSKEAKDDSPDDSEGDTLPIVQIKVEPLSCIIKFYRRASPYAMKSMTIKKREAISCKTENIEVKPLVDGSWMALNSPPTMVKSEPAFHNEDSSTSSQGFGPDENTSYFHFFRGIHSDYMGLSPRKQRLFKRQCLNMLHDLVDEEDATPPTLYQDCAMNLSNSAHDSDEDKDKSAVHIVDTYSLFS